MFVSDGYSFNENEKYIEVLEGSEVIFKVHDWIDKTSAIIVHPELGVAFVKTYNGLFIAKKEDGLWNGEFTVNHLFPSLQNMTTFYIKRLFLNNAYEMTFLRIFFMDNGKLSIMIDENAKKLDFYCH